MASYVLDEFLGGGLLKDMGPKFAEDGWDDVPTLKVIGAEDMEALDLTDAQRDALELRIYLHNRSLMKYADRMEASKIGLIDLMSMKPSELASKFKMRKTHVATFVDTSLACGIQLPFDLPRMSSARRRSSTASRLSEDANSVRYIELPKSKPLGKPPPFVLHKSTLSESSFGSSPRSPPRKSNAGYFGFRNSYSKRSPPLKSNAGGLGLCENVPSSPPRKSNAGDSGFRNSYAKNSPPRKSSAGELGFGNSYAKNSPPRKSSAGELGFRNSHARNSPPRKSNVGELGFNGNPFSGDSPPRRSNVGDFGFHQNSFARNSPPRKSNAGELGFNGNPCTKDSPPRQSNAGEYGFNGNSCARNSPPRRSNAGQLGFEQPAKLRPAHATKAPNAPKGVYSATNTKRQLCGMVKAPSSDKVTKISVLEKVSLRQLAPEHSYGVDPRALKGSRKLPPFKASNLWSEKATLFFCIRRPGCVMCRAEAHQLFARKPIFDALGIQLVAVLLEDIDEEVWAFWPRYWAGMVVLDENRDFFRALGGGKLMKDSLFTGFFLNPIARLNWKRAMKTGIQYNTRGEGTIKGGMFIVRPGKGGVAYQFAEKNFGDWAPLDEVLQVCHHIREEGDSDGY
ncbi:hypothetical protein M758_4G105200 [Ceratodon purpureus]|nr:hypothetical protein M758_4G105200 [Ceratodon purpureus]